MRINKILLLIIAVAFVAPLSMADEQEWSGFMSDYSKLEKIEDGTADYRFVADDWEERMTEKPGYHAIMVDQPEILLAEDSPYKGAKPRHLEALAEAFRAGLVTALSDGGWYVVDRPGPNTMYARVGINVCQGRYNEPDAREEEEETVGLHAGRAGGWRRSQCGAIRYRQEG
jgi:hypothetical protein